MWDEVGGWPGPYAMQTKRKERSDAEHAYKRARSSIKQLEKEKAGLVQARSVRPLMLWPAVAAFTPASRPLETHRVAHAGPWAIHSRSGNLLLSKTTISSCWQARPSWWGYRARTARPALARLYKLHCHPGLWCARSQLHPIALSQQAPADSIMLRTSQRLNALLHVGGHAFYQKLQATYVVMSIHIAERSKAARSGDGAHGQ